MTTIKRFTLFVLILTALGTEAQAAPKKGKKAAPAAAAKKPAEEKTPEKTDAAEAVTTSPQTPVESAPVPASEQQPGTAPQQTPAAAPIESATPAPAAETASTGVSASTEPAASSAPMEVSTETTVSPPAATEPPKAGKVMGCAMPISDVAQFFFRKGRETKTLLERSNSRLAPLLSQEATISGEVEQIEKIIKDLSVESKKNKKEIAERKKQLKEAAKKLKETKKLRRQICDMIAKELEEAGEKNADLMAETYKKAVKEIEKSE
ncbi:MAG: hypothetical protein HYT79_08680 [Elusimicrobia bacterium]|nr:hypothetical protein [Elusimicrobiota bacterium]